jgi:hypothetical protein
MLSAAASAHRHAQAQLRFSNIMCLDVGSCRLVQAAAEAAQRGAALFPEHRCVPTCQVIVSWCLQ